jgi:dephospho-CoA kinase
LREPEGKEFKRFTSFSYGNVTEREFRFKTNPLYPWLDNRSFNKWFIPKGCGVPISKLSIEVANKYDFRAPAFRELLEFLKEKRIINLKKNEPTKIVRQADLPFFQTPIILVSGFPCAGKTTIGQYLAKKCGYYHIEASDFMYLSYYETHGLGSSVKIGDFAEQALKKTPNIVVDQIIKNIQDVGDYPIVITGFRSPKEISLFTAHYHGSLPVDVGYITATEAIRYNRSIKRGRADKTKTKKEFRARDKQQYGMGLKEIKKRFPSRIIKNDSDIRSFVKSFLSMFGLESIRRVANLQSAELKHRPTELENAIIIALLSEKKLLETYRTTTEIAHLINSFFDKSSFQTSKNNVSRYFNQNFHPYYDFIEENRKNKYRLSQTGISRGLLLLNRH